MDTSKLKLVVKNDTSDLQLLNGSSAGPGCVLASHPATATEGLRLIRAFANIKDPRKREWILAQAEKIFRDEGVQNAG